MRFLVYLTTLLLFSVAAAQSPTILQGDYISNVFGNSNFVRNPNAQTTNCTTTGTVTCQNVTVSNAEITRSTTTPLVAKSEFLMITTTSTGSATWSTRTFDSGMKGQNCEARFSYRGFSVGSTTAQILQGANVVAQLTLTPSTDPRIASINFPCGDLSAATTFRLQQASASLTGTNEIGGIYVGLATNMANVAQAEFVGSLTWPNTSASDNRNSITWEAFQTVGAVDPTPVGSVTSPNRAPRVTVPNLKAGNYRISFVGNFLCFSATNVDSQCGYRITDGTTQFGTQQAIRSLGAINGNQGQATTVLEFDFQYTGATTSKTFQLETIVNATSTNSRVENGAVLGALQISVYRFPSSSELVVTPERQNVFAAAQWPGSSDFSTTTVQTNTKINTTNFGTPSGIGKAQVTSLTDCGLAANDIGFCVKNVPPGNYKVAGNLVFGQTGGGYCSVNTNVSGSSLSATKVAQAFAFSATASQDWTSVGTGYINIPSFQSYVAVYFTLSVDTTATCNIRSANAANKHTAQPTLTFEPLDQPSNSALYVQGPVKAAETGAAIPAGYLGQTQLCSGSRGFVNNTNGATGWSLNSSVSAGCTLTPGIYLVRWSFYLTATSGTSTGQKTAVLTTDSSDGWPPTSNLSQGNLAFGAGTLSGDDQRATTSIVTVTPSGISGGTGFVLYGKILVSSHTSFTGTYYFDAAIVRLN